MAFSKIALKSSRMQNRPKNVRELPSRPRGAGGCVSLTSKVSIAHMDELDVAASAPAIDVDDDYLQCLLEELDPGDSGHGVMRKHGLLCPELLS